MKPRSIGVLAIVIAQCAAADTPATASYSERDLLKNWTLSSCLSKAYASEEVKNDAGLTAGAYLEFGSVPIEAYEAANALVDEFLARSYSGSMPSAFNTMKCIDLYHSRQLADLVKKWTAGSRKKSNEK